MKRLRAWLRRRRALKLTGGRWDGIVRPEHSQPFIEAMIELHKQRLANDAAYLECMKARKP
jgi:hypothetical protein